MRVPSELILCMVTGLLAGELWRRRAPAGSAWTVAAARLLTPVLLGALAYAFHETLLLNTRWGWSACRLAPTIGLLHGYPLYSPADHGPINGWLYGPVAALAWIPAALGGSPQPALFIAAAIDLVLLLAPLAVAGAVFSAGPGKPRLLGFAYGAAGLLLIYPTWYMASVLNADAIAVALGAGSCLVLAGPGEPRLRRLLPAALLGALAAWTKQVEAPLVVAQLGWLWLSRGRSSVLHYAAAYAGTLAVVSGVFLACMGPRGIAFNMWVVPAGQAFQGGWPAAWAESAEFVRYAGIFYIPCLLILLPSAQATPKGFGGGARDALTLLLLAALVLMPLCVMAVIKVGGDRNSLHPAYYLAVAAVIALSREASASGLLVPVRRTLPLLAACTVVFLAVRQVAGYPALSMLPGRCLSQEAWTYSRLHPASVYYPWDPLATLMGEGRAYPFEYGVQDRILARQEPADAQIQGCFPTQPESIVYPRVDGNQLVQKRYFPDYALVSVTADWLIYRRKDGR
jgi:hypothetical protein